MQNTVLRRHLTDMVRQSFFIILISISVAIGANLVRTDRIPYFQDWSAEAIFSGETGKTHIIQLTEAEALFKKNQVIFLDAWHWAWPAGLTFSKIPSATIVHPSRYKNKEISTC